MLPPKPQKLKRNEVLTDFSLSLSLCHSLENSQWICSIPCHCSSKTDQNANRMFCCVN